MKNEFHYIRNRRGGFAGKPFITLTLAFILIVTMPLPGRAAGRFDERKCSLTVKAIEEYQEDLTDSDLVIDLYKIADASPYAGSDGYSFSLKPAYENLVIGRDMSGEDWGNIAQEAAMIALGENDGGSVQTPEKLLDFNEPGSADLDAGLYLLIARNKDSKTEDYVDYIIPEDGQVENEKKIVTKAFTDEYVYTFLPELVSLPGKPEENGVVNTANSGDWIFDAEAFLKPEQGSRYGLLKIVKTLEKYNVSNGPATFVFDVEAVLKGEKVYSDVVSIVFKDPGVEEILVEKIPVGAEVTVTEVYTGASYKLISDASRETTIVEDLLDPSSVSFTNDYDERQNGGHSITNHFTYEAEENTETDSNTKVRPGAWKLEQLYDLSQDKED